MYMTGAHHFEKTPSISGDLKENRVHYASKKRRKVSEQDGHPNVISAHVSFSNSEKSSGQLIALNEKNSEYLHKSNSSSYAGQMMPVDLNGRNPWTPHDPRSGNPTDPNVDALHQAMHKLLDIADRIPFIGVESTNSKVCYSCNQSLYLNC
jgi:hypothetical protein